MSDTYIPRIEDISPSFYELLCKIAISEKISAEELLEAVRKAAAISYQDINEIAYSVMCALGYNPLSGYKYKQHETLEVKPNLAKLPPLQQIVNEDKWTLGQLEAFHRAWEDMKGRKNHNAKRS